MAIVQVPSNPELFQDNVTGQYYIIQNGQYVPVQMNNHGATQTMMQQQVVNSTVQQNTNNGLTPVRFDNRGQPVMWQSINGRFYILDRNRNLVECDQNGYPLNARPQTLPQTTSQLGTQQMINPTIDYNNGIGSNVGMMQTTTTSTIMPKGYSNKTMQTQNMTMPEYGNQQQEKQVVTEVIKEVEKVPAIRTDLKPESELIFIPLIDESKCELDVVINEGSKIFKLIKKDR